MLRLDRYYSLSNKRLKKKFIKNLRIKSQTYSSKNNNATHIPLSPSDKNGHICFTGVNLFGKKRWIGFGCWILSLSFLCVGYEGQWTRAQLDMATSIQGSLGALIASAPASKIAELERQVSMLHNMKNNKFLDCIFRDMCLAKEGLRYTVQEERDRWKLSYCDWNVKSQAVIQKGLWMSECQSLSLDVLLADDEHTTLRWSKQTLSNTPKLWRGRKVTETSTTAGKWFLEDCVHWSMVPHWAWTPLPVCFL